MHDCTPRPMPRLFAALLILASVGRSVARAVPTVEPPFDDRYFLVDLGAVPGVGAPYGAVAFVPGDPDTILVGERMGSELATLRAVGVTRDATGSIDGFAGPAVHAVDTFAAGGGLTFGPGSVLFYSRVTFEMGEVKPGSAVTDKIVNLRSLFWSVSGLAVVPAGMAGAGELKAVTQAYGEWWTLGLAPDAAGTYDVTEVMRGPSLPGNPTGFAYVAPDDPGYFDPGLLLCEHALSYGAGNVVAYDVDAHGDPIVATRQVVVSGLDVPEGIATDPVTGDVLFAGYQGRLHLLRSAPIPTTTTSSTSSTTSSSTTSTSTTSTSTSTTSSSSSTTASSTTSTTTSSTSLPETSTSSTSSTTTTTTLPGACTVDLRFDGLACRVERLATHVRGAREMGSLQAPVIRRVERAQAVIAGGTAFCAAGARARARRALAVVARHMRSVRARMRSPYARKTLTGAVAGAMAAEARGVSTDARALRRRLVCPWGDPRGSASAADLESYAGEVPQLDGVQRVFQHDLAVGLHQQDGVGRLGGRREPDGRDGEHVK